MEVSPHIRCLAGSLWKVVRGKLDGSSPHIRCMAGSLWKVVRGKLDGSSPHIRCMAGSLWKVVRGRLDGGVFNTEGSLNRSCQNANWSLRGSS
jgi:hypothetical protein